MSERQKVKVMVIEASQYDGNWPPEEAHKFLAWLSDRFAEIPDEHMPTARVEIGSTGGYEGSHYATIEVSYERPETDEEVQNRIARYRAQAAAREAQERETLAKLKAKYGT